MARNQNHDDDASSSSRKRRVEICDNNGATPWSGLNHDVLLLVMMQLNVVDFVALSGVCKSWRSFALRFLASRPPMLIRISNHPYTKECYCHLEDIEGRKFKTLLPHSADTKCIGLTCGYLILLSWKTDDYWLVNPTTMDQLHFPAIPILENLVLFKCILVFSNTINRWVFVVIDRFNFNIWFSIEGKGAWSRVSSTYHILDLHVFKGKIYALNTTWRVYELRLNPKPKLTLLKTKNFPKSKVANPVFVSSDENLYVMDHGLKDPIEELDFGVMKWVSPKEKTIGEYSFFCSDWKYGVLFRPELWVGPRSQLTRYDCFCHTTTDQKCQKGSFFSTSTWYFPLLIL